MSNKKSNLVVACAALYFGCASDMSPSTEVAEQAEALGEAYAIRTHASRNLLGDGVYYWAWDTHNLNCTSPTWDYASCREVFQDLKGVIVEFENRSDNRLSLTGNATLNCTGGDSWSEFSLVLEPHSNPYFEFRCPIDQFILGGEDDGLLSGSWVEINPG
jgi:hypothetical protein